MSSTAPLSARLLGIGCALIIGCAALAGCRRDGGAPATASPPQQRLRFTDVTAAAGILFSHQNGAEGHKYMPETMGSGCAFLDYDGDGWQDVLLVNGQRWSGVQAFRRSVDRKPGGSEPGRPALALYRNEGKRGFRDVTAAVVLDVELYGMGVAVGDYDNDGDDDLAVTALGGIHLFQNQGGQRFERVVGESRRSSPGGDGSGAPTLPGGWPTSAAWVDYDRDGRLDLFVCHYVQWTPETDVYWSLDGVNKSYTTPEKYVGESCRLYHNRGGGRLVDVTRSSGIYSTRSKALGVAVCDYDLDGWPDLLVSNDTEPTLVYHNQGDGTFHEVASELGVAVAESGKPKAGMGIDTGDDRNSGSESILITNFAGEQLSLYRKDQTGLFLDEAAPSGVGLPSQRFLGFGTFFFDADLNGWLDIFVTNGHVMDDIERRNTGVTYAEPALLFQNLGDGRYQEVGAEAGPALAVPQVGRGAAYGDYDNDGDLDLLLTSNGGRARLLRNDSVNGGNWLKLQLQGAVGSGSDRVLSGGRSTGSNRGAIGARVQVWAGDQVMTRTVKSGSSYLSSSDRRLVIGLGPARQAERIEIQWPSGAVQSLGPVERNRWLRITEGRSGSVAVAR